MEFSLVPWILGASCVAYGMWKKHVPMLLLGAAAIPLGFAIYVQHRLLWLSFALTTVSAVLMAGSLVLHARARRQEGNQDE